MKNKMAICEWCFPTLGPSALKFASDIGFEGIQLGDLGGATRRFPMNEKRIQEAYMQASVDCNIEIQALHLYTLTREGTMLYPMNSPEGEAAMLSIRNGIDACAAMNIPVFFLSSFFATFIRNDAHDFMNFAAHLKYAVDYASDRGVQVVYESVLPIDRFLRMREIVGDGLKILYDICNPYFHGSGVPTEEIKRFVEAYGVDVIDQIHVKDRTADFQNWSLLGEGGAHVLETADLIRKIGWSGWLISETYYFEFDKNDPRGNFDLMERDLKNMRRIFNW